MRQTTLLVTLLLAGSSLFAADPQLLSMAPSDANSFAGINVEQAKTSQFGQFLLNSIPQNSDMEEFITKTGFDPRTDLREVLIAVNASALPAPAASEPNGTAPVLHHGLTSGLVLAKGTFNTAKILAAATADHKVQVSTYSGVQLLSFEGNMSLALIDASTAVMGESAGVKTALDRRNGSTSAIDPAVMARINQLSTTEDIWSVSTKGLMAALPLAHLGTGIGSSAVLQNIQQASGGIKFGSGVVVTAQVIADNAQDAASLGDVVKMLSQMIAMHGGASDSSAEVTNFLKTLNVTTDGAALNISLTLAEDQLEALVSMAHGGTKI